MEKKWSKIFDFPKYSVSTEGEVRNDESLKVLSPWKNSHGYLQVSFYKKGKKYNKQVHRLVAEAFIPNPENKPTVNHCDEKGTKTDNRVSNLKWATMSDQMNHVHNNNLSSNIGETHVNAKIKKADIKDIVNRRKNGDTLKDIARFYGVTRQAIAYTLKYKKP